MKMKSAPVREVHPYGEYLSSVPESLIIGSFPIGKFSHPDRKHEIKKHEFDFYYGGEGNQLWKLLAKVFETDLTTKKQIVTFVEAHHISLADVIRSCKRKNGSGNDADLFDIEWNTGLRNFILENHFKRLYFTSKKVYHWYCSHIGRIEGKGAPEEIILLSPSANGLRSIPRMKEFIEYKNKIKNKDISPALYRERMYKKYFTGKSK
jgi:G:T/U-mismatch repair DNA glycosylase